MRTTLIFASLAWGCLSLTPASRTLAQDGAQDNARDETPNAAAADEFRTWTDASGEFSVEAAIEKLEAGRVHLRERDGNTKRIALAKLSKDDQKYVREWSAKQKQGTAKTRGGRESTPSSATGTNWPGWLGPNRDGKSPDTGLLKQWPAGGPPLLWKVNGIGRGYGSVAVVDDTVYVTGVVDSNEVVTAVGADGKTKWQIVYSPAHDRDYPGSRTTPTLENGKMYLLSGAGQVCCLDTSRGQPAWAHNMREFGGEIPGWAYAESVLIHKDMAIVTPGGDNCIVALNKKTGEPLWSSKGFSAGAQYGSCIAVNHRGAEMIVAGTAGGIVAVEAGSGRMLWSNPFSANNTANCPTPAYADGYVFWANGYDQGGICLQLESRGKNVVAQEAWKTREMVCHHGGYIIHEGYIYGNHAESWVCLDLKTGERKWRERAVGKGSVCYADGMLYLFSENGGEAALANCSPDGLEMHGKVTVEGEENSWAHPVVIGGKLYLRYADNLYCFNVRAGT